MHDARWSEAHTNGRAAADGTATEGRGTHHVTVLHGRTDRVGREGYGAHGRRHE